MSDTGMKWYVLRTVSGQEHKTKTYIEKDMAHAGMSDLVGRVLIPMEERCTTADTTRTLGLTPRGRAFAVKAYQSMRPPNLMRPQRINPTTPSRYGHTHH